MIDKEQAQHMTDVAGECNRLNEISQPLGYAVTATTTVDDPSMQHFTIHRLDKTVANGSKFFSQLSRRFVLTSRKSRSYHSGDGIS